MRRSRLQSNEPSNDWFSDALTPASMKRRSSRMETEEVLQPVEEEDPEQAAEPKKVVTPAVHADLTEIFNQIMED